MWLYRGAQSAVFYYATCTPCANTIDRRKRKKDAARCKRENAKLEAVVTDQPRPFPQPTPFSTNQGWMEEIALGPGPPARRGGHRSAHRRTESWNTDGVSSGSCLDLDRKDAKKDKGTTSLIQPLEDRWNRLRNQREDEPLWGEEVEVKGSSVGISGRGRAEKSEPSKYYIPRVPPVNDLHPPIVSGPKSRAETRWMLQPPPSARVMAGKERFGTSTRTSSQANLSSDHDRYVGTKPAVERKQLLPPLSTEAPDLQSSLSSPTPVTPHNLRTPKTPGAESDLPLHQSSPTALSYSRDESRLVITTSIHSPSESSLMSDSEAESPRASLQSPGTPISRPGSKDAQDGLQPFRPSISKTLSTLQRDTKKVHLLHLEINDAPNDIAIGEFERLRPWRWSMDV